jgi:alkyl sulfatase BDS1-like metallo-beta-lactamase superfamily hydrolase
MLSKDQVEIEMASDLICRDQTCRIRSSKRLVLIVALAAIWQCPSALAQTQPQAQPKPATKHTIDAIRKATADYPWSDKADFQNAKRGLIAPLPDNGVIKGKDGKVVNDLSKFDFIKQDQPAPDTVNPSLWRVSQLLNISGLFEVVPGVYQVRGADLANMTIVEGDKGITIYDPLTSEEAARYALDLYYQHRPRKPVVAVIHSHSHVDHVGGVRGVVDEADVKAGKVKIYAPEGFLNAYVQENVYAGTAMSRRSSYQYGFMVPPGPKGYLTSGLGPQTSAGTSTLIAPTDYITKTGEKRVIDGIEYEFLMAPGSEAPAEMMWYLPKFKLINTAEDAAHTQHNIYTLRGAKTRDALKWPTYLNEALRMWGDKYDVEIGMHEWPTWGNAEITRLIKAQRDTYKYIHDQTLHYANMGYTLNELPELVKLPKGLLDNWATHGYYGSTSHNSRAVYNYYLGYYDGNPANLDPLTPAEASVRYVAAMGGPEKVMAMGREAFEKGEYRWGATLVNHVVFAQPDNQEAKNLQADLLEQLGYQTENGTWRGWYLVGASELRNGVRKLPTAETASADTIANMPLDMVFDYMGIRLDAKKAEGQKITLNLDFPDIKEHHAVYLENSVLNHWPDYADKNADATVTLDRATLNDILSEKTNLEQGIAAGKVRVDGNQAKFANLVSYLTNLNGSFWFNIVTPNLPAGGQPIGRALQ